MRYAVKFLPQVLNDLAEAKSFYINRAGKALGERFKRSINKEISRLQVNPEHYQIYYLNLRRVPVKNFPYAIFYLISGKVIIILAILHTAQDTNEIIKKRI